jgi:hypothetical protein
LLALLDRALAAAGVEAELCLVGGAVVTLAFNASPGTRRITAMFAPARSIMDAADQIAARQGLPSTWLQDAARRHIGGAQDGTSFVELANLRVFASPPAYAFAMKCAALRVDAAPSDFDDLRYLLRFMNVQRPEAAMSLLERYFSERQLPADIRETLQGLLAAWPV